MRKIILLAGLVAGGVALSVTASANNWLLYLPAILAGSGGGTVPPPTTESNKWLLFLPAILAGSQGGQPPVVTGSGFNDTGIVLSSTGGVCVENGKEDCNYGRDVTVPDPTPTDGHAGFSFTKLDTGGGELPYDNPTWACVQDNVTMLTWSLDQDVATLSELQTIVDAANNTTLCGGSGWRLPLVEELIGIVDYHKTSGTMIESTFFTDIKAEWYWTSNDYTKPDSSLKWGVNFSNGKASTLSTTTLDANRVLLVR